MARRLRPGDHVFFTMSNGTVTGEGMTLGYAAGKADDVVILLLEGSVVHAPSSDCSSTGSGKGPQGMAERTAYLKRNPGALKP
jgi:hypothetical protein